MKFTLEWLKDHLDTQASAAEISTALTTVGLEVESVEDAVRDLEAKGVTFEHYDLPDTTRQGDVHVSGPIRNAWFKDPDGNILAIMSGMEAARGRPSEVAAGGGSRR